MNIYLLFVIALIPIVGLMIALGVLKMPGYIACPVALLVTFVLALIFWDMTFINATSAALEGAAMAIWPIVFIIIAAVFTYNITVESKAMDLIKDMMTGVTTDRRILVLIVAWGFGGFLEAIAGFGTAVAIPAGILAALGFDPLFAAVICLIANTTPTAFGAVGLPVSTLANVANLDVKTLGFYVVVQLFVIIVIVPFILVMITGKSVKAVKGVFWITLASGLAFALPQLFVAKYLGAELPAIIGSICAIAVTVAMCKIFHKDTANKNATKISLGNAMKAWSPFILVFLFIVFSSTLFPAINGPLSSVKSQVLIYQGEGGKPYTFYWLSTPGTLILIAGFMGGLIQGLKISQLFEILWKTCKQMSKSAVTVLAIVALAKVMSYSGMIKSIAVVLVQITGGFYPLIAPLIGALGTFVTGSDTSSNVLFGQLQAEVAMSLNIDPTWLCAANTGGATAGKMISPQSIAVATAATGLIGYEGKIFAQTIKFCLGYVAILGVIVYVGSKFVGV